MADKGILALNGGSGSLKMALFSPDATQERAAAQVDWTQKDNQTGVTNHDEALKHLLDKLHLDPQQIGAVGYRVVHGGTDYAHSVRIDDGVKQTIERLGEIAPLHNPVALKMIAAGQKMWPDVPHIATFDTAFHASLAPSQYVYGLPYAWYTDWGIRRFGFHGLSMAYSTRRAAEMLGVSGARLIICHLGSGCSITAVRDGGSVATTMGFTPLEGLLMATRSGSLDPSILIYAMQHKGLSASDLERVLNKESGLKGVSGVSGDMRDIVKARAEGNAQAVLAYDIYIERVQQAIGSFIATLGGLDALIFTDGTAEHMSEVRADIVTPLDWLGIRLDPKQNATTAPEKQIIEDTDITGAGSRVRVLVIRAREELEIAREVAKTLSN